MNFPAVIQSIIHPPRQLIPKRWPRIVFRPRMNAIVQTTNGGPETHTLAKRLLALIGAGEVHAVIDRHYPLTDLADPHRYVETGRKVGNVIVDVT